MDRIYVNYQDITLGELSYNHGMYCYVTIKQNIDYALQNGYPISIYFLNKDFIEPKLPLILKEFVPNSGTDLYESANINENDSEFEKLLKVAEQPLCEQEVFITTKKLCF